MPSDNEIRKVIEILKRDGYWGENKNVKAFDLLLSLAELYLQAAEGMPEERKADFRSDDNYEIAFRNGFNEARSLCIAAFARKIDKKKIDSIIKKHRCNYGFSCDGRYNFVGRENAKELAQAIIKEINGKEVRENEKS